MNRRISWTVTFGIAAFAVIGLALLVYVPTWMYPYLSAGDLHNVGSPEVRIQLQQAQSKLQNDARSALLQGLAGLVVVVGGVAA
jgi:hypothetical protein